MPGGNRRGPENRGPMTGRGLGYCAGYDAPGWTADAPPRGGGGLGRGYGRGYGRGFGRGGGWGRRWGGGPVAQPQRDVAPANDETAQLHERIAALEEQIARLTRDQT